MSPFGALSSHSTQGSLCTANRTLDVVDLPRGSQLTNERAESEFWSLDPYDYFGNRIPGCKGAHGAKR